MSKFNRPSLRSAVADRLAALSLTALAACAAPQEPEVVDVCEAAQERVQDLLDFSLSVDIDTQALEERSAYEEALSNYDEALNVLNTSLENYVVEANSEASVARLEFLNCEITSSQGFVSQKLEELSNTAAIYLEALRALLVNEMSVEEMRSMRETLRGDLSVLNSCSLRDRQNITDENIVRSEAFAQYEEFQNQLMDIILNLEHYINMSESEDCAISIDNPLNVEVGGQIPSHLSVDGYLNTYVGRCLAFEDTPRVDLAPAFIDEAVESFGLAISEATDYYLCSLENEIWRREELEQLRPGWIDPNEVAMSLEEDSSDELVETEDDGDDSEVETTEEVVETDE